mmetsp:Transcript_126087/g.251767  ORF Transcript_126087/g.251767 Transcript_126087/m.251767 type:complete len:204 (+) Transcript_126087:36-647(+)
MLMLASEVLATLAKASAATAARVADAAGCGDSGGGMSLLRQQLIRRRRHSFVSLEQKLQPSRAPPSQQLARSNHMLLGSPLPDLRLLHRQWHSHLLRSKQNSERPVPWFSPDCPQSPAKGPEDFVCLSQPRDFQTGVIAGSCLAGLPHPCFSCTCLQVVPGKVGCRPPDEHPIHCKHQLRLIRAQRTRVSIAPGSGPRGRLGL